MGYGERMTKRQPRASRSQRARKDTKIGDFDAKTHFSELLDRVQDGETITIARNGIPVARLARLGELESNRPAHEIAALFRAFQEAHPRDDESTRDWILDGRRR